MRNEVDSSFAKPENQLYMLKVSLSRALHRSLALSLARSPPHPTRLSLTLCVQVPLPSRAAAPTAEAIAEQLQSEAWTLQDVTCLLH